MRSAGPIPMASPDRTARRLRHHQQRASGAGKSGSTRSTSAVASFPFSLFDPRVVEYGRAGSGRVVSCVRHLPRIALVIDTLTLPNVVKLTKSVDHAAAKTSPARVMRSQSWPVPVVDPAVALRPPAATRYWKFTPCPGVTIAKTCFELRAVVRPDAVEPGERSEARRVGTRSRMRGER